ncbi:SCO family protein [Pseudoalteromonas fenneropenaei]|uniref:SCO family protein n=1 Tax=Pseudoalteromonas fenneropenaei TaxID=1737459 RepID=A0ABV7CQ95_9GAMM
MRKLLTLISLLVLLGGCEKAPPQVAETTLWYPTAKPLAAFTLTDQFQQPVTNQQLYGHWNWLFVGYTSCPDICPMTLAKLAAVRQQLDSQDIKIWFISVDPKRDNADKLKAYSAYFGSDIIAATAPHSALFPFVRDLGLIYAISESESEAYSVDHSAAVALIDPQGKLVALFKPEFKLGEVPLIDSKTLRQDFLTIRSQY